MQLTPVSPGHPLWLATSIFIRTMYLDHYGARLINLPTKILALVDARQKVHCAAGLREGAKHFFSEIYLDEPIETVIGRLSGKPVERREIVEVSSLASRTPAASVQFMRELILYGDTLGFNWAFFTATGRLQRLLERIRLPVIDLGAASAERVPNAGIWGCYYETAPRVLAIGREDLAPFLVRDAEIDHFAGVRAHG